MNNTTPPDSDFAPMQRDGADASSAARRVYRSLRQSIISFERPPGAVLSRVELTREYGVSQTPIREALQMLEQDGLIRVVPQSRTLVRRIDVQQLNETHFLRVALECEVVRRLAKAPPPDMIRRARAIIQMKTALVGDTDQIDMFKELDRTFHQTLFAALGVDHLLDVLGSKLGHLARCQWLDLPKKGKMADIVTDHTAILDAIKAGDPEAADRAMRHHLSGTISRVEYLRAEHPDYFTDAPTWGV